MTIDQQEILPMPSIEYHLREVRHSKPGIKQVGGTATTEENHSTGEHASPPTVLHARSRSHDSAQTARHKPRQVITRRRWTEEEDQLLAQLVEEYGNQWGKVSARFKGRRTQEQCRGRWRRHLHLLNSKDVWNADEDQALMAMCAVHGKAWASISKRLPGRTPGQCRTRSVHLQTKTKAHPAPAVASARESQALLQQSRKGRLASSSSVRLMPSDQYLLELPPLQCAKDDNHAVAPQVASPLHITTSTVPPRKGIVLLGKRITFATRPRTTSFRRRHHMAALHCLTPTPDQEVPALPSAALDWQAELELAQEPEQCDSPMPAGAMTPRSLGPGASDGSAPGSAHAPMSGSKRKAALQGAEQDSLAVLAGPDGQSQHGDPEHEEAGPSPGDAAHPEVSSSTHRRRLSFASPARRGSSLRLQCSSQLQSPDRQSTPGSQQRPSALVIPAPAAPESFADCFSPALDHHLSGSAGRTSRNCRAAAQRPFHSPQACTPSEWSDAPAQSWASWRQKAQGLGVVRAAVLDPTPDNLQARLKCAAGARPLQDVQLDDESQVEPDGHTSGSNDPTLQDAPATEKAAPQTILGSSSATRRIPSLPTTGFQVGSYPPGLPWGAGLRSFLPGPPPLGPTSDHQKPARVARRLDQHEAWGPCSFDFASALPRAPAGGTAVEGGGTGVGQGQGGVLQGPSAALMAAAAKPGAPESHPPAEDGPGAVYQQARVPDCSPSKKLKMQSAEHHVHHPAGFPGYPGYRGAKFTDLLGGFHASPATKSQAPRAAPTAIPTLGTPCSQACTATCINLHLAAPAPPTVMGPPRAIGHTNPGLQRPAAPTNFAGIASRHQRAYSQPAELPSASRAEQQQHQAVAWNNFLPPMTHQQQLQPSASSPHLVSMFRPPSRVARAVSAPGSVLLPTDSLLPASFTKSLQESGLVHPFHGPSLQPSPPPGLPPAQCTLKQRLHSAKHKPLPSILSLASNAGGKENAALQFPPVFIAAPAAGGQGTLAMDTQRFE